MPHQRLIDPVTLRAHDLDESSMLGPRAPQLPRGASCDSLHRRVFGLKLALRAPSLPHPLGLGAAAADGVAMTLALEPRALGVSPSLTDSTRTAANPSLLHTMRERADGALAQLLVLHWPIALGLATLRGTWMAALVVGGLASCAPLVLAYLRPGAAVTRVVVAICLMLYSMLFIAQTGGMIEMH